MAAGWCYKSGVSRDGSTVVVVNAAALMELKPPHESVAREIEPDSDCLFTFTACSLCFALSESELYLAWACFTVFCHFNCLLSFFTSV